VHCSSRVGEPKLEGTAYRRQGTLVYARSSGVCAAGRGVPGFRDKASLDHASNNCRLQTVKRRCGHSRDMHDPLHVRYVPSNARRVGQAGARTGRCERRRTAAAAVDGAAGKGRGREDEAAAVQAGGASIGSGRSGQRHRPETWSGTWAPSVSTVPGSNLAKVTYAPSHGEEAHVTVPRKCSTACGSSSDLHQICVSRFSFPQVYTLQEAGD
jgi:hypothetical protein